MATTPTNKHADLSRSLQEQIALLRWQAGREVEARSLGNQTQWMVPARREWDGDPTKWADIQKPFDRTPSGGAEGAAVQAVADPRNRGTTGDLTISNLQIDYLSAMERAYRLRHTVSRSRAISHMCGRKLGHANSNGPLAQASVEFLVGLVKQNSGVPS